MNLDMNTLRSSRNNDFSKITKEFEKSTSNSHADDRFWKPERDKAGNATATIRFLPRTPGDELPWVKMFSHGFKSETTGRWFIEECLTTLTDELVRLYHVPSAPIIAPFGTLLQMIIHLFVRQFVIRNVS